MLASVGSSSVGGEADTGATSVCRGVECGVGACCGM